MKEGDYIQMYGSEKYDYIITKKMKIISLDKN